jgi:hypothetical protein
MTRSRPALIALAVGIATVGLCACGKVGYLEQSAPLWGEKAKADYKARQAAHAAAAASHDAGTVEPVPETLEPPQPGAATPLTAPPAAPAPRTSPPQ